MRFAKFFFALIFGAVFIITLFKVLFFALMATFVVGGIFLASRAFGYRRFRQQQWASPYGSTAQFSPFNGQQAFPFGGQQSPFEQPLNPNWQKRPAAPVHGRRIEVL